MYRWPVGVVISVAGGLPPSSNSAVPRVTDQSGASFAWLQSVHSPWPLSMDVVPPAAKALMWSNSRIGASQYDSRHRWSCARRNCFIPSGNSLA